MNLKKLHQVLLMSIYGFALSILHGAVFGLLLAHSGHAQKSIDEISVDIGRDNQKLAMLFSKVEQQTSLIFSYDHAYINDQEEIAFDKEINYLGELLRWIAKEKKMGFKRVDDIIYIKKYASGEVVEDVLPELPVQVTVKGSVVSQDDGEPLPGVTILVKGTSSGTTTNIDGEYSISVAQGSVLQFSYIGFQMQEIVVGNESVINVQLMPDLEQLEEVVVVGYGTQKRRDVTGAINSIESEKIKDLPVAGIDQALQGKIAGVNISQASGQPGGAVSVQIRGVGSIGAGSQPLYVIDGYPFSTGAGTGENPLNFINPADIEKIDVLKDAAATAIYGSRGANGVIMITTKRGKEGQSQIQFSTSVGFQQLGNSIDIMGADEFTQFVSEARNNYYARLGFDTSDDNIRRFINVGNNAQIPDFTPFLDSVNYPGFSGETNWLNQIFQNAPMQNYQLTGSGGTDKVRYAIMGSYFNQEGIVKGTGFERFNFRANIDAQLSDKIKAGLNISPTFTIFDDLNTAGNFAQGGIINAAMVMPPTVPIYEADGSFFSIRARGPDRFNTRLFDNGRVVNPIAPQLPTVENPLHMIDNQLIERKTFRTISNLYLDIEIIEGLNIRTSFAADITNNRGRNFLNQINPFVELPSVTQFSNQNFNWLSENTLTYSLNLNEVHRLNAMIGYTAQKNVAEGINVRATEYSGDFNPYVDPNLGLISGGSGFESPWSLESYIARVNYVYNDKYLITATVRRDGSSRFGPSQRYGVFPSVALGWRISEESFLQNSDIFSDVKLRGSYGEAGNFEIGNFQWVGQVGTNNYVLGAGSGQVVTGALQTTPSNSALTWETSKQLNIGADVGIVGNRIQFILDYYRKTTSDLLLEARVPFSSGFVSFIQNVGEMVNEGWEFSVSSQNTVGAFEWTTDFNISRNVNEVTALSSEGERLFTGSYHVTVEGQPVGSFFGYQADGVYLTQEEADAHEVTLQNGSPYAGARRYADLDGDGQIDPDDRTIIGNPLPEFILGVSNRFKYKNFDLNIQLNGQFNYDVYNVGRAITESGTGFHNNTMRLWENRYISPEQPGNGEIPLVMTGTLWNNELRGSHLVEDGSFLRIQNVTLGYTLPSTLSEKLKVQYARAYVSAQNLYTFTSYTGFDPEVSSQGTSQLLGGIDFGGYPLPRIYTLGFNVTF